MNRFRQLKEEEKKKTLSNAASAVEVEISASVSDSEDESDEEIKSKVNSACSFQPEILFQCSAVNSNYFSVSLIGSGNWILNHFVVRMASVL